MQMNRNKKKKKNQESGLHESYNFTSEKEMRQRQGWKPNFLFILKK